MGTVHAFVAMEVVCWLVYGELLMVELPFESSEKKRPTWNPCWSQGQPLTLRSTRSVDWFAFSNFQSLAYIAEYNIYDLFFYLSTYILSNEILLLAVKKCSSRLNLLLSLFPFRYAASSCSVSDQCM